MNSKTPFFVGYLKIPAQLKSFLLIASVLFIAGFAATAVVIGATQDDPGKAGFRFDLGRQTVTGVLQLQPYPTVRVLNGSKDIDAGRTIMLSGGGKTTIPPHAMQLDGELVEVTGILLKRGELDMLQLAGGKRGVKDLEGEAPSVFSKSLGRWKLAGEICDGKCLAGAMQPGRGLAHKACANLCLIGGIPPVFVSSKPVAGQEFFLIGDADGGPLPADALHIVGQFIELEGEIEQRGDLLLIKMDMDKTRVLP
ncbi:MAG: hypothetical protein AAGF28_00670 [Pseudomonadota bacterium]